MLPPARSKYFPHQRTWVRRDELRVSTIQSSTCKKGSCITASSHKGKLQILVSVVMGFRRIMVAGENQQQDAS
jgi:hypothetical protein